MHPVRLPALALLVVLLAGVAIAGAILTDPSDEARAEEAALEFGAYLQRSDGRTADPVNLIFAGERDAVALALKLSGMLRWTPVRGDDMSFQERGVSRWAEVQLGSMEPGGFRKHIRLAGAVEDSERWGPYTLAGVHRDIPVPCGHIGSAFDSERDAVAATMRESGYAVRWLWLGNTGGVEHCDGSTTRGDGWAAVIEVRRAMSPSPSASSPAAAAPPAATAPSPSASPSPTASPSPAPSASPTPAPAPARTPAPTATPAPSPPQDIPEPPPPVR